MTEMRDAFEGPRVIVFGCFTSLLTVYLIILGAILLFRGQLLAGFALWFVAVTAAAVGTALFGKLEAWLRRRR